MIIRQAANVDCCGDQINSREVKDRYQTRKQIANNLQIQSPDKSALV